MVAIQIFLEFSPLFGEDFPFDSYFSDGLKPPTSVRIIESYCNFMRIISVLGVIDSVQSSTWKPEHDDFLMLQANDESLKTTLVTYNSVVKAAAVVESYGWQQALDILKEMEDVQLKEAWCFNIQPTDVVSDWDLWHPKPSHETAIAENMNYFSGILLHQYLPQNSSNISLFISLPD